jgi:hypothetical protein
LVPKGKGSRPLLNFAAEKKPGLRASAVSMKVNFLVVQKVARPTTRRGIVGHLFHRLIAGQFAN